MKENTDIYVINLMSFPVVTHRGGHALIAPTLIDGLQSLLSALPAAATVAEGLRPVVHRGGGRPGGLWR